MTAIIPPYLQPGDTIGMVCPSGFLPFEKAQACINTLQQWGFRVLTGTTMQSQHHYFSATDAERLADLQRMLDDASVQAILFGRGGYGLSRIIDQVDFSRFIRQPKWLAGFSDITVLLNHIYSRFGIASLHSPMAAAFNGGTDSPFIQAIRQQLTGEPATYTGEAHALNRPGEVTAPLTGGNLAILAHLAGTASAVDTRGKILFLEDVGEYLYSTDRMLQQLKRNGMLEGLAGLIVGRFADMKDTTIPFGNTLQEMIANAVAAYNFPVCFEFPVGHVPENYPLKIGVSTTLQVTAAGVTLAQ